MRRFFFFFALIVLVNSSSPLLAQWNQAEGNNFRVYSRGDVQKLRDFAVKLEKFDAMLRILHGIENNSVGPKTEIYLVENVKKVAEVYNGKSKGPAGYYKTQEIGAFAVAPEKNTSKSEYALSADEIIFHEYTHDFMARYMTVILPGWYREGLADFYSTVRFRDDGEIWLGRVVSNRVPAITRKGIYNLRTLLNVDSRQIAPKSRSHYYATGWLLTHFLFFDSDRKGEMTRYLEALNSGKGLGGAALVFQGGLGGLTKDLKTYGLSKRLSYRKFALNNFPTNFPIAVSALPADRSAFMEMEIRYRSRLNKEQAIVLVPKLSAIVATYPNSSHGQALLADFLYRSGDRARAEKAANKALEIDRANGRALLRKARIYMAAASKMDLKEDKENALKTARRLIVKANRADTNNPAPLHAFYHIGLRQHHETTDLMFNGLKRAHDLVPHYGSVRFEFAKEQANRGKIDEAMRALRPLAFSPHGGRVQERSKKLYEDLQKKKLGSVKPKTMQNGDAGSL